MSQAATHNDAPRFVIERNVPVTIQVYAHLRRLILRLHLQPGEALSEKEISVRLGLSRTPVREAFIKLADEGLVDILPQRGTFVAPIRVAEVDEAQFLRSAVEIAVVRRAAQTRDGHYIALLEDNLRKQTDALECIDHDAFMDLDEAFHRLLSESVSLPRAWRVIQSVKGQLDRVRFVSLPERGHGKLIRRQHAAILRAVKAGDADLAGRQMQDHLDEIGESVEKLLAEHAEFFGG